MKKHLLFLPLLALVLVAAPGCEKILDLLSFTVSDSQIFTVPAAPLPVVVGQLITLPPVTVASTAKTTYANNGTAADYVQDVTLDRLALTITNPASQNFDFLRRIELYISTDASGSNKVLLASLSPVPTGVRTIELVPSGNKLDLFLRNAQYTLTTNLELAQPLAQNTDIRADSRFNVKAKAK